ncbi:MAG: S-adenosylmethionine decarboxylase [Acidobacteriota bacterium]
MIAAPLGIEWLVDAEGCDPGKLRSPSVLRDLFQLLVAELDLHPIGEPAWHVFDGHGGVTGFWMLAESHLACHTFPEEGRASFNLYCCRPRDRWRWEEGLKALGAGRVTVRSVTRGA